MQKGFAKDISVIIPARCEQFSRNTVEDVLAHMKSDGEIIFVADGSWPEPPLVDHPRLKVIHTTEAVGQRAATNLGAQISRAKYVMKLDAHCSVSDGFDVKLIEKMEPDMTMIPAMHRLHVFDWMCECGEREYQGNKPDKCASCGGKDFTMAIVWQPRFQYEQTVAWRFDANLHFQYWRDYHKRPEVKSQVENGLIETMTCIGACFLMERKRYWKLGGMAEEHGSWGQYGVELALKAWLSGGRMVTNTAAYFAHMFRSGNFARNGSSWPYPIQQVEIDKAREYSRELWLNNSWKRQTRPLSWLLEHFWPVPEWTADDLARLKDRERKFASAVA